MREGARAFRFLCAVRYASLNLAIEGESERILGAPSKACTLSKTPICSTCCALRRTRSALWWKPI
jgi:hypothetical protein